MAGNVQEWVADCWHTSYVGSPETGAAWTTDCVGDDQTLRGGDFSFDASAQNARSRWYARTTYWGANIGVRCAWSPAGP